MSDPYTDYLARFGAAAGPQPPAKGPAKAPPAPAPDPYSAYLQQYGAGQGQPAPERDGSTAAGLFAAPLDAIPGAQLARGVVGGLMDAGSHVLHGQPANVRESVRAFLDRQGADTRAADRVGGGFPAAGLRGVGMGASAALSAPKAAADAIGEAAAPAADASQALIQRVLSRVKGTAPSVAQNATRGASYAMAGRALAPTTESVGDRLQAAPQAALAGAAAGVVAPALIGRVLARGAGAPTVSRATQQLGRDVERSGQSFADLEGAYAPGMTLADVVGRPAQRRLDYAMSVPNAEEPAAATFLQGRASGRGQRLQQGVEQALGTGRGNVVTDADALAATTTAHADHNYGVARGLPPVDDPDILAAIDGDPVLRAAHGVASRIVARATGEAQPPLTRTRTTTLLNAQGEPVHAPVTEYVPQSIAVLDLMKRAINDVVGRQVDGGSTVGHYEAAVSTGRLNDLLKKIDTQRPEYGTARATFRTDTGIEKALESGQSALQQIPEQIAHDLPGMVPEAQQRFRQGMAQDVWQDWTGKDATGGRALNFFRRPITQDLVRAAAPDPAKAADLQALVGRETTQAQTENTALRNSETARRLQMAREAEADTPLSHPLLHAGGQALVGHFGGAARSLAARGVARYGQRINEQTAQELIQQLLAGRGGQEEFSQALARLQAAGAEQGRPRLTPEQQALIGRVLSRGAGSLTGSR